MHRKWLKGELRQLDELFHSFKHSLDKVNSANNCDNETHCFLASLSLGWQRAFSRTVCTFVVIFKP